MSRREIWTGDTLLGMPRLRPMLAEPGDAPFDDDGWLFEPKWDGYRCLAYLRRDEVYLDSRNGNPLLSSFPELSTIKSALTAHEAILDGEIVALRDGRVDFSALREHQGSPVFIAFDLLYADGEMCVQKTLQERRDALLETVRWGGMIAMSTAVRGRGIALFREIKARGMEGVMAKRGDSLYFPGRRTSDWLKLKNVRQGEFWVVGYAPSPGSQLGSLVIAEKTPDGYRVVGRVSSGLNEEYRKKLVEDLVPMDESTIQKIVVAPNILRSSEMKDVRWVRPFYGVEIDYTEITPGGHLRHPVLKEVLEDDGR